LRLNHGNRRTIMMEVVEMVTNTLDEMSLSTP
jgi:hypothetical protein